MTDYTPAQLRLIDQHRDINTDHDWWDGVYEQFIEECKAFGIEISTTSHTYDAKGPDGKFLRGEDGKGVKRTYTRPEIYFSLYQQGADAYFNADSFTIPNLIEAGRALMLLPADHDNAWMQTAEEGVAKALRDNFERLEREFGTRLLSAELAAPLNECTYTPSISRECITVEAAFDPYSDGDATDEQKELAEALENDWPEAIRDMLRDVGKALHGELESEYEHLCSDDEVWEALVANDMLEDLDEDDEEEAA